ncbi:hypothetical protein PUR_42910 [Paenibacillus sp. URB8-2]|nr:hypothetical protein PUR_42910 [Paenibacillus sp. URB8-2]
MNPLLGGGSNAYAVTNGIMFLSPDIQERKRELDGRRQRPSIVDARTTTAPPRLESKQKTLEPANVQGSSA